MATYVALLNLTDRGGAQIKDSPKRATTFKSKAQGLGLKVKEIYWTLGAYDGVLIFEAPDDETATAALLNLSAQGNVRTHTLRAFTVPEIEAILAKAGL